MTYDRLIWAPTAPAPFESAWSLFLKIMALNYITPKKLHSLICKDNDLYMHGINLRDSSWVDFNKLSFRLGVPIQKLKGCFLDQMNCSRSEGVVAAKGIKVCSECLTKGYHSVFFELAFIDRCPWHNRLLEAPCQNCYATVSYIGLRKPNIPLSRRADSGYIFRATSNCGHVQFSSDVIPKINQLSHNEEKAILTQSREMYLWMQKAMAQPELMETLFSSSTPAEIPYLGNLLYIAEQLAGSCPWISDIKRTSIRWLHWYQSDSSYVEPGPIHTVGSDYYRCYRSVRRHLFKSHLSKHRSCINSLTQLTREEFHELNSDQVCPVVLAYFAWRIFTEMHADMHELRIARKPPSRITSGYISKRDFRNTLIAYCNQLIYRFYSLWQKIEEVAGQSSFSISIIRGPASDEPLIINASRFYAKPRNETDKHWVILFPDSKRLENLGFIRCTGKYHGREGITDSLANAAIYYRYALNGPEEGFNSLLFRATKRNLGRVVRSMAYLTV